MAEQLDDNGAHAVRVADRQEQRLALANPVGVLVVRVERERLYERREYLAQVLAEYVDGGAAAEFAEGVYVDGRLCEVRYEEGQKSATLHAHDLLEAVESALGQVVVVAATLVALGRLEQVEGDLVERLHADHVVQVVEGARGRVAYLGKLVGEGAPHRRHEAVGEGAYVVAARVGHDLGEADAHALALLGALRVQAVLEYGYDVGQDAFAELAHDVDERAGGYLPLVGVGARQAAEEQVEERWQDVSQRARRIRHDDLPDVEGRVADLGGDVAAAHVQARVDAVATLGAERLDNGGRALLGAEVVVLVSALRAHLAHHAADLVQQVAEQLHAREADAPIRVEQALLQLGQEERYGRVRVGVDDALARFDGRVAHKFLFFFVGIY